MNSEKETGSAKRGIVIEFMSGVEDGRRVTIHTLPVTIGRLPENALPIQYDDSVSRRHAQIVISSGQMHLEDVGSRYGTFVDGKRVTARTRITAKTLFQVGRTWLRILSDEAPAPAAGQPVRAEATS